MSKKSELGRLIERSAKGQKTVLGLPGQTKVTPQRAAEIMEIDTGGQPIVVDGIRMEHVNAAGGESTQVPNGTQAAPESPPPAAPVKPRAAAYTLGKKYSPKSDRNTASWNKLLAALGESPKTMPELQELLKDHKDFISYMLRNGHLLPVSAPLAQG